MGGLLGDLTIVKRQNSYRVKVAHSPKNKDYVYWKYEQLKRLCHSTQPPVLNGKNLEFYLSSSLILSVSNRACSLVVASGSREETKDEDA